MATTQPSATRTGTEADRRRGDRWVKRLRVRFWRVGKPDREYNGYTTDISATGLFVKTSTPVGKNGRIQLEICSDDGSFLVEGIVARCVRVPRELQSVKDSGMGVRFVTPEELVREIVPAGFAAPPRNETVSGTHQFAPRIASTTSIKPQRTPASPNTPQNFPPEPTELTEPTGESPLAHNAVSIRRIKIGDLKQFLRLWERHLQHGRIFVSTDDLPPQDQQLELQIHLPASDEIVKTRARVSRQLEPQTGGRSRNLLGGAELEFLDWSTVEPRFLAYLKSKQLINK